jgi:small GTP-binding protein
MNTNILDYEYIFKICVIGPSMSGKTSLLNRFINNTFNSHYYSTIGSDFFIYNTKSDDIPVKLQLWDLAGNRRFRNVIPVYCRGTFGCILMFDLSDRQSYNEITEHLEYFQQNQSGYANSSRIEEPVIYLVGNKNDLNREVLFEEAEEYAKNNNMKYVEISVKNNIESIDGLFRNLTNDILVKILELEDIKRQEQLKNMKDNINLLDRDRDRDRDNYYEPMRNYSLRKCCN